MKIKVVYTTDSTGMSKDEILFIEVQSGDTLYCYSTDVIYKHIWDILGLKDYDYLHIWKVYVE
jgi:hypothetical protein